MGRGPARVLIATLALGLGLPGAAASAQGPDPTLDRLAAQSGCTDGPRGYVAGYFAADEPGSGVFWCRRGERYAEEGRVVIVVVDRDGGDRLQCPHVIVAINEPAALRVLREQTLPLSAFVDRHQPWRTGPAGQIAAGPIVDAVDGEVGEQWICYRGAWLVRVYH